MLLLMEFPSQHLHSFRCASNLILDCGWVSYISTGERLKRQEEVVSKKSWWFCLPLRRDLVASDMIFFFYTVYLLDQQRPATSNTKCLKIHPGRITWNLRITQLKRKIIFQTIIFRFHVSLPGCISIVLPVVWLANLERFSIHAVTEEPLLYFGFGRILPWSLQDLQTALSKYGFHFDLGLNLKLPFRVNLRVRENRKRQWKVVAAWE